MIAILPFLRQAAVTLMLSGKKNFAGMRAAYLHMDVCQCAQITHKFY